MAPRLEESFVEAVRYGHAGDSAFNASRSIGLALREARSTDGDALQAYVRRLSPQSRYNRFLGGANELPALELARALAANGRDTLTLLLTSTAEGRETVAGEARVALSCAERVGEFRGLMRCGEVYDV